MNVLYSLVTVLLFVALAYAGGQVPALRMVLGVLVPGIAVIVFLAGLAYRVLRWAGSPVPFRIPTTSGQQKSLPWIKAASIENPSATGGVLARMAFEVLTFRSLFKNTRAELRPGPRLLYGEEKYLWLAAIAFHYSFLVIFIRHLRFFMEPTPGFVNALAGLDGFFQVSTPVLYLTDVFLLAALCYLLWRRLGDVQVRYVSLFSDYFALFLLLGIGVTGVLMRYFTRVDLVAAKQLAIGLVSFSPVVPDSVGPLVFVHLFLVERAALGYFPFSKLVHMAGIFLSPTRNLANNNRMRRHVNPWDYPVKVHTYEEWEDDFRDKIKAAGLPLERE